jgi:hypothetical protein
MEGFFLKNTVQKGSASFLGPQHATLLVPIAEHDALGWRATHVQSMLCGSMRMTVD